MSNVSKGNKFEDQAEEIIYNALASGELSILSEHATVHRKKGYYSNNRKGNIEFDISIEVKHPEADRPTLLYIIECKSYGGRIPVDEVETFHSQLIQLNQTNIKGVFVTDAPFQKGGKEMLKSLGIMHIQADLNGLYDIVLFREEKRVQNQSIPFVDTTKAVAEHDRSTEVEIDKQILSSFSEHIEKNKVSYGIDNLSKKDIATKAKEVLNEIDKEILKRGKLLEYDVLKKYIRGNLGIKVLERPLKDNILGETDFNLRTIRISSALKDSRRRMFVLAHELGHFILHSKLRIGQHSYENCVDHRANFQMKPYSLKSPKDWIEWQANYFAESLIMNDEPFKYHLNKVIKSVYGIKEIKSKLIVNDSELDRKKINEVVENLSYRFEVSKSSIYIKLDNVKMIENRSRTNHIGTIWNDIRNDFYI